MSAILESCLDDERRSSCQWWDAAEDWKRTAQAAGVAVRQNAAARAEARDRRARLLVGEFVVTKYRQRARENGVHAAATALKKQGYPISLALAILARR
jgi:hypothetical protein